MAKLRAVITVEYEVDLEEYGVETAEDAAYLDQENIEADPAGFLAVVPPQFKRVVVKAV